MKHILDTMTRGAAWLMIASMATGCASLYIKSGKEAYQNMQYQDAIYSLEKALPRRTILPRAACWRKATCS